MLDYGNHKETVEKLLKKMHDALDGNVAEDIPPRKLPTSTMHIYTMKEQDGDNPFKTLVYFNDDKSWCFRAKSRP